MAVRAQPRPYPRRRFRSEPRPEFGIGLIVAAVMLTLLTVLLLVITAVPSTPVSGPRGGRIIDTSGQPVSFEQGYDSPRPTAAPVGVLP